MSAADRDARGRFTQGNRSAVRGGQVRAAKLPPTRRQEIARLGWQALVERRFSGDARRAAEYIGRLGAWAAERTAYAGSPLYQPTWEHPGPLPGGEQ